MSTKPRVIFMVHPPGISFKEREHSCRLMRPIRISAVTPLAVQQTTPGLGTSLPKPDARPWLPEFPYSFESRSMSPVRGLN